MTTTARVARARATPAHTIDADIARRVLAKTRAYFGLEPSPAIREQATHYCAEFVDPIRYRLGRTGPITLSGSSGLGERIFS